MSETPAAGKKTKIAILGGGAGALTAAFYLTQRPEDRERYELTVYQLGWRLGGKGASGRNPHLHQRIEEHGVHVFLGFYENAFRAMRECYDELGRPPDRPLSTALGGENAAFKPHDVITVMEKVNGQWQPWHLRFPHYPDQQPGLRRRQPSAWQQFKDLTAFLDERFERNRQRLHPEGTGALASDQTLPDHVKESIHNTRDDLEAEDVQRRGESLLKVAHRIEKSKAQTRRQRCRRLRSIRWLLEHFVGTLDAMLGSSDLSDDARHFRIVMKLGIKIALGMVRDGVLKYGYDVIDRYDFTEWLQRHGCTDKDIWWSPVVRGVYGLVFGYEPTDVERPNLAAGVALRGVLRMFLMYRGSIIYKMQAGMGDTIFAPMYEVLRRRGVTFKFFHRVENLKMAADGKSIAQIQIARQVDLKRAEYEPLVDVKDLPCWPSEPLYEQINDDQAARLRELKKRNLDLESAWIDWQDAEKITLRAGRDFDQIVLGIPVGALPHVCSEIVEARPVWKKMVDRVKTIQTQAFQLWMTVAPTEIGWQPPAREAGETDDYFCRNQEPMLGAFQRPVDSWVGMSQTIPREQLPTGEVKHVGYFFNTFNDAETIPPPFTDPSFPASQLQNVKREALDFLTGGHFRGLWPKAADPANPDQFDWNILFDAHGGAGPQRLDAQYLRVNVNPTDRYVLSPKGSTRHRMKTDESGFENLYLAGDWIYSGMNAGCAEAAVMSGMQAARAICQWPQQVFGETDVILDLSPLCAWIGRMRGARNFEPGHLDPDDASQSPSPGP